MTDQSAKPPHSNSGITRLIIARHGNTFTSDQTPTRVGCRTDLALTEQERAKNIGRYIKHRGWQVNAIYSGPLKRHKQTAMLASAVMQFPAHHIQINQDFNEIDYGPDENRTEAQVIARLGQGDLAKGQAIIDAWNADATVPEGWIVDVAGLKNSWRDFADQLLEQHVGQTVLLVSSNGVMRFAPAITDDFAAFVAQHPIKVATGGVCVFEFDKAAKQGWQVREWAVKPAKVFNLA